MMLICMIGIDKMLKLTKGQGHKVKGQGQKYKFVKNTFVKILVSPINHEQMIGSLSKSYIGLISMTC